MADILLSVGLQQGASGGIAELLQDLRSQLNRATSGRDTEIKIKPVVDSSGFSELKEQVANINNGLMGIGQAARLGVESLYEMHKVLTQIASKENSMKLDFAKAFDNSEDVAKYRAQVKTYLSTVKDAQRELVRLMNTDQSGKSVATIAGVNGTQYFENLRLLTEEVIPRVSRGLNLKNTGLGPLQSYASDLQEYMVALRPLMEMLNNAGASNFDLGKLLTIPEKPITAVEQMKSSFTSLDDILRAIGSAIGQNVQSTQNVVQQQASSIREVGDAASAQASAVESSVAADNAKAASAQNVTNALNQELDAIQNVSSANNNTNTQWYQDMLTSVQSIQQAVSSLREFSRANTEAEEAATGASRAIGENNRVLMQISQGRFSAELSAITRSFNELSAPTDKLKENMAALRAEEERMEDRSLTDTQRLEAYEKYNTVLQTVKTQIRDLAGAENPLKKFTDIQDKISNNSLKSKLDDMILQYDKLSVKTPELTGQIDNLKQAFTDLLSNNDLSKMDDFFKAYERWQSALEGAKSAMSPSKKESSAVNAAEAREAADAYRQLMALQKEISSTTIKRDKLTFGDYSEYERLSEKIHQLQTEFDNLYAKSKESLNDTQTKNLEAAMETAKQKVEELNQELQRKAEIEAESQAKNAEDARLDAYEKATRYLAQIAQLKKQVGEGFLGTGSKEFHDLEALEAEVNAFRDSVSGMLPPDMEEALKRFGIALNNIRTGANGATTSIGGMSNPLYYLESRLMHMLSLGALIMKAFQQIKKMVQETIALDTSMTQLRIVTDNSGAEYAEYGREVAQTAKELGASMTDLIDSTTVFARLGYSLEESNNLSTMVAMLKNVGDIDVSTATDSITTMIKAFKDVDATNIETAMDKLVTVGNNFPISVKEIAEGINNAGSSLAAAGNSFDKAVALLTAANTAVQDISKASTGLRTISARIRRTKFELDDLGETIEEAKYQEALDILTGKGVRFTENGEYRDTYDILKDLAAVWKELSSMDKAAIAEQLAGTRQQNIFYSLIDQFGEAEAAIEAMKDSGGALRDAYGEYSDSIQRHIDSMKSAFTSLSQSVVDSDLAKTVVDKGTQIITFLQSLNDTLKPIGGLIPATIGLFVSVLASIGPRLMQITGLTKLVDTFKALNAAIAAAAAGTASFAGIWGALGIGGQVAVIISTIAGLIAIIKAARNAYLEKHPTLEMLKEDADNAQESVKELQEELDKNNQRIQELNQLKTDGKITDAQLTELANLEVENERLKEQLELRKQIAEYKEGVFRETKEEQNRKEAEDFFATGRRHEVRDELTGDVIEGVSLRSTTGYGGILNAIDDYNKAKQDYITARNDLTSAMNDASENGIEMTEEDRERLDSNINTTRQKVEEEAHNLRFWKEKVIADIEEGGLTIGQIASYQALIGKMSEALGEAETSYDKLHLRDLEEGQIQALSDVKSKIDFRKLLQNDKDLNDHVRSVIDEASFKSIPIEDAFYFTLDRDALEAEMQSLANSGSFDILVRPIIDAKELTQAGWEDAGEGAATLFSVTYANEIGNRAALFTPIFMDDQGQTHVMSPDELGEYASKVMSGAEDELHSKITLDFEGEDAIEQANAVGKLLSDYQGIYFADAIAALNDIDSGADKAARTLIEYTERVKQLQETIKSLSEYASEAMSDSGLSFESVQNLTKIFKDLEGFNAEEFFDITSTGIRVNSEELGNLTEQYYELEKKKITDKIRDLRDEAYALKNRLSELTDAEEDVAEKQDLIAQSDALEKEISEAEMAAAAIDGMTNAYMNYLRALNTPNQNENYLNIANGFKTIGEMINAGWVGNDDVTKFLDYIYADRTGVLKDNETAWKNLFKTIGKSKYSIKDFYTPDSSQGVYNFLDTIDSIFPKYVTKHKNGKYSFDFKGDRLFEIQDRLNLSIEAMQDIERAMESAGFHVDFNTLTDDVARASYELKKMGKIKFSLNDVLTGGADVNEAIDSVLTRLEQLKDPETGQIDFSTEGAQEAYDILMRLLEIRDQLNGKDASVDVETNTDSANKDLDDLRKKIDELENLNKQIEIETELGNDPQDLEDRVREILDEVSDNKIAQELEVDTTNGKSAVESFDKAVENKEVTQTLTVEQDGSGDDTAVEVDAEVKPDAKSAQVVEDTIPKEITTIWHIEPDPFKSDEARAAAEEPLTATLTILGELDPSVASAKAEASVPPSNATVTIVPDPNPYDTEIARVLATEAKTVRINLDAGAYYSAIGAILAVASKTVVITTHLFTIDHGTTGGGGGGNAPRYHTQAQGTAHSGGTAMKKGYWGAKKDEEALVGEVGPELRVRDGRWELIGEDSAEIADIRKGDIIFNAEQTRQILKNGKIKNGKKRGITYLNGTAYDSGTGPGRPSRTPTTVSGGTSHRGTDTSDRGDSDKTDWIEVWITRFEYAIERLASVAEDTMKRLSTRLSSIANEISETEQELKLSYDMYERYMYEASSIGLDESIARLVRGGAIDISFYGEETRSKIQEYQTWYEKALDVAANIEEMHRQIGQLYIDSFEYVQKNFEDQIEEIEHKTTMAQKNLDMARKKGYLDNASFFETMASIQEQEIAKLNVELQDLNFYFKQAMDSHEIDEGSEAWYEMRAAIHDVEEAIADANIQLVDYQKTIRSIQWDYFDYAHERLQQISQEANFLVDVMSNDILFQDSGKFTELGEATAAMRAVNFNQFMLQADEYNKERLKIEKQLADDPFDKELIERRESLLELQQQSIMAAENEKDAVADLVEQGINKELEALQDLIDTYNDSLDSAKDLYEYQKKVTEKTADIASIQKQLSAYTNDTSEETRAKVQKLQKDLQNARDDLSEVERDKSIEEQKRVLEELYDEYESFMNARLDDVDLLMEDIIAGTNENMDRINTTIQEVGAEVGYTVTEAMLGVLRGDLSNYDYQFESLSSVAVTLDNIYSMVAAMARASGAVKAYATGGLVDYTGMAAVHGTRGKPELMLNASDTANFLAAAKLLRETQAASSMPGADVTRGFVSGSGGMNIGQISMAIQIDHVQDYNDLVTQMRNDPKFERLINAMTLDRAVGKSSFGKNKIVF